MGYKSALGLLTAVIAGMFAACSSTPKSPDVADSIRKSLDQSGCKDVAVSQDRDTGVVKLTGHVPVDSDKVEAEEIAHSLAPGQVIADEIIVFPLGDENAARAVNPDVDAAIGKLLDAALIQNQLHDSVKYQVQNGVVILTGEVHSQANRTATQNLASGIPNVQQVVNELQVKDQKATGSN